MAPRCLRLQHDRGREIPSDMGNQKAIEPDRIVYEIPGMEFVHVKRNLTYRSVDGLELKLDAHYPG